MKKIYCIGVGVVFVIIYYSNDAGNYFSYFYFYVFIYFILYCYRYVSVEEPSLRILLLCT